MGVAFQEDQIKSQIIAKTEQSETQIQESSEEKMSKDVIGDIAKSHEGTPSPERKKLLIMKNLNKGALSKEINSPANKSIRGSDYDYQIKQQ